MDRTTRSLHHRSSSSSSSDRLLGAFTFTPSPTTTTADELNEAELFWAGDISESENQRPVSPPRRRNFDRPQNSGILAVLAEPDPVFRRKSSVLSSSSRMIPSLPRPPAQGGSDYLAQSVTSSRKFQQSAPVKVPILMSKGFPRRSVDDDDIDDDEMLPPHEIVARGSGVSPKTTFSVLEGVGRTLKGRDLRQFSAERHVNCHIQQHVIGTWIGLMLTFENTALPFCQT